MQQTSTVTRWAYAMAVVATGLLFGLFAVPKTSLAGLRYPKKDLIFTHTGTQPQVIFKHAIHVGEQKLKCTKCHTRLFQMKAGRTEKKKGKITMALMEQGKFCGACHNGKRAFSVKASEKNCSRCHVKQ